jgi:DNA end-binding protein Ku
MAGRTIWKGAINFSNVNVPVKLHSAVRERRIAFNLLHAHDQARLRQQMICSHENVPVPREHQIKGYAVAPGQYVIVPDAEMAQVEPQGGRTIEVLEFVRREELDPRYYQRLYYLEPENSPRAFNTLSAALAETGLIGICRWHMRRRSYLGALRPGRIGLDLATLRFPDEVVARDDLALPQVAVSERELKIGTELIDNLSAPFKPEQFQNEYQARLQELIAQKAAGRKIKIVPFRPKQPTAEDALVRALTASLKQARAR